MDINLNIKQKSAIVQFLNNLTSTMNMMKWDREVLFLVFSNYNLSPVIELNYSDYIYTLRQLPFPVKRDIVRKILDIWSCAANGDYFTLYNTLQKILYLKIETGVECVLFNNILNLATYFEFSHYSFNATAETDYYMIDMLFDFADVDFSDNTICFTTSAKEETPRVEFNISDSLLKRKMSFINQPSQDDVFTMLQHLTKNHTKTHCPWIYLDYTLDCNYRSIHSLGGIYSFLHIEYGNIQYIDNNG